jgi:serine/threonine-protein kinase
VTFDVSDPRIGTTVGDGYRLDEPLGAGGMGVVYKGVQVPAGTQVAVKFLHDSFARIPDLVKRFEREIVAMRRVRHANLVSILDSGVSTGVPYLVMEFQQGRSLAAILDEEGRLPARRALRITTQVLAGVEAAHASGVVHRDLKPDNILLCGDGDDEVAKILDFGLAKMVSDSAATQLTNTGLALGTPAYMAPEQARGTGTDHRADLYSVGVILFHMLTGKKPFVSDTAMAVMRMQMDVPPPSPRQAAPGAGISNTLERVILRSLAKNPDQRWPDASSFARALEATPEGDGRADEADAVGATEVGKRVIPVMPRAPRFSLRRVASPVLKVVAVASVGFFGFVAWQRLGHQNQQDVRHAIGGAVDKAKETVGKAKEEFGKAAEALRPKAVPPPSEAPRDDDDDDEPTPPKDTPGAKLEAAAPAAHPAARALHLSDAIKLVAANKPDEAVQVLYQLRKKTPHDADVALWLGHAYFKKLWRTDGLREYDLALDERPSLRWDKQMLHNAVWALDDPTYGLARSYLRKWCGASAVPELRRAARDGKTAKLQARAGRLAVELAHAKPRAH